MLTPHFPRRFSRPSRYAVKEALARAGLFDRFETIADAEPATNRPECPAGVG
jgi:hypothetical protein